MLFRTGYAEPTLVVMSERLDHAAFVGAVLAGGGAVAGLLDWSTRPPCPDGYVRLIDVGPIAAVLCGALAFMLAWRAARTLPQAPRRKEVRSVTVILSVVLTAASALPALLCVALLLQHSGETVDSGCWTL